MFNSRGGPRGDTNSETAMATTMTVDEYKTIMNTVNTKIDDRIAKAAPEARAHLRYARLNVGELMDLARSWPLVASPLLVTVIRGLEAKIERIPKACTDASAAKKFDDDVFDLLCSVRALNPLFSVVSFGVVAHDAVAAIADRASDCATDAQSADGLASFRQPFLDFLEGDLPAWADELGDRCPQELRLALQLIECNPGGLMGVLDSTDGGALAKPLAFLLAKRIKPLVDTWLPGKGHTMADLFPATPIEQCASLLHRGIRSLSLRLPEVYARSAELVPDLYLNHGAQAYEYARLWQASLEEVARVLGFRSALSLPELKLEVVLGNLETRAHVSDCMQQILTKLESMAAAADADKAQLVASYEAQLQAKDSQIAMLQAAAAAAAAGQHAAPMGPGATPLSGGRGGTVFNNPAFGGSPAACSPAPAKTRMPSLARQEQCPCNR